MSRLTGLARTKSDWNEYSDMLSEEGERHFVRNMEEGGAGLHEAHAFVSEVEAYNRGTLDQSMILEDLVFGFGEEFSSQEAVKKIVQREDDDENDEFEWTEITKDEYYFYLEVLPPIFHTRKGFMLSERYTDNITRCVVEVGGKYFTAHVDFTGIKEIGVHEFYEKLIKESGLL